MASGRRGGCRHRIRSCDPWPGIARLDVLRKESPTRRAAVTSLHDAEVWSVRRCAQGRFGCRSRQTACGPRAPMNNRPAPGSSAPLVREPMSEAVVRRPSRVAVAVTHSVPQGSGQVDLTVEGVWARQACPGDAGCVDRVSVLRLGAFWCPSGHDDRRLQLALQAREGRQRRPELRSLEDRPPGWSVTLQLAVRRVNGAATQGR